jgi:hypothetical protein
MIVWMCFVSHLILHLTYRLAHALASSFNFQGRVKKTFFVLTDDKVGAGPRLRPQSGLKPAEKDTAQPMETDSEVVPVQPPAKQHELTLSAKLAAKRKATEPADGSGTSGNAKSRR